MIETLFWCSICSCGLAFGLGGDALGGASRLSGVPRVVHTSDWRPSALGSKDEEINLPVSAPVCPYFMAYLLLIYTFLVAYLAEKVYLCLFCAVLLRRILLT